jgi:hypothetical protein
LSDSSIGTPTLTPGDQRDWSAAANEIAEGRADFFRVLRPDQAERHLGHRLARDNGLRPFAGIAANDAVDLGGRPRRDLLDHHAVLLARRDFQSDLAEEFFRRQIEAREIGFDVGRQLANAVVETGDGDRAVRLVQRRKHVGEHVDGIARRAAEQPRVQIAVGAGEPHLLVDKPAQRGRDRGRVGVPHTGVADERQVAPELGGVLAYEAE